MRAMLLLSDTANGPAQIACAPAFPLFSRQRRNLSVWDAFLAVLHPAVLETEFQGAHIPCCNQFSGSTERSG